MIDREDYEEPSCLLLDENGKPRCKEHININAVMSKLDELYNKEDYEKAKQVICYWIEEAKLLNDKRAAFSIYEEGIGLSRRISDKNWGLECVEKAFEIANDEDLIGRISAGTCYLNGATTLKTFGNLEKSLVYFEKAKKIYIEKLENDDYRFASLYNNYALALVDNRQFKEAESMFNQAIDALNGNFPLEVAITYTNLSDLYYKIDNIELCDKCLYRAYEILSEFEGEKDGYYAFVLKKCATAFSFHGYFKEDEELLRRAKAINNKD